MQVTGWTARLCFVDWDFVLEPLQQDKGNILIIYNGLWMGLIILRRKGQSKGRRCKADKLYVRENSPTSSPDKKSSVRDTITKIWKNHKGSEISMTATINQRWENKTFKEGFMFFSLNEICQRIHLLPHHLHHPHHSLPQTQHINARSGIYLRTNPPKSFIELSIIKPPTYFINADITSNIYLFIYFQIKPQTEQREVVSTDLFPSATAVFSLICFCSAAWGSGFCSKKLILCFMSLALWRGRGEWKVSSKNSTLFVLITSL